MKLFMGIVQRKTLKKHWDTLAFDLHGEIATSFSTLFLALLKL